MIGGNMILCVYKLNDEKFAVKLLTGCGKMIQSGVVDVVLFNHYPLRMKQGATLFIHAKDIEIFTMEKEEVKSNVSEWHREELERLFENKKELLVLRIRW
jgi:hypothetical protein